MYKFLITKVADHHAALLPLWWYWYTKIYPVDYMRVTAMLTPGTSIDKVVDFFEPLTRWSHPQVELEIAQEKYFDEGEWWPRVLQDVERRNLQRPFTLFLADADEFYEPPTRDLGTTSQLVVYSNWVLVAPDFPTMENIRQMPIRSLGPLPWNRWKAVLVNHIRDPLILPAAHYRSQPYFVETFDGALRLYHLAFQGQQAFIDKCKAIVLRPDDKDWHWPLYVQIMRKQGEQGLRTQYDLETAGAGPHLCAEAFKRYFPLPPS